jgi:hypothetical protein
MQKAVLSSEPADRDFDPAFRPELAPQPLLHWAYDGRKI